MIGKVKYAEAGWQRYNTVEFLFAKRRLFEKERELRVVVQCYDPMASLNRHLDRNGVVHREPIDDLNPRHEWVHDCKRRRIALDDLVTEIRASPWATPEVRSEISLWHKNKKLTCRIAKSELASQFTSTLEELKKL